MFGGWQYKTYAEYELVGAKVLFGGAFINYEVAITGIVYFLGKFYIAITHECGAQCGFEAGIPAAELEALVVDLTK